MQCQLHNPVGANQGFPAWMPLVFSPLYLSLSSVCPCLLQASGVWGGNITGGGILSARYFEQNLFSATTLLKA